MSLSNLEKAESVFYMASTPRVDLDGSFNQQRTNRIPSWRTRGCSGLWNKKLVPVCFSKLDPQYCLNPWRFELSTVFRNGWQILLHIGLGSSKIVDPLSLTDLGRYRHQSSLFLNSSIGPSFWLVRWSSSWNSFTRCLPSFAPGCPSPTWPTGSRALKVRINFTVVRLISMRAKPRPMQPPGPIEKGFQARWALSTSSLLCSGPTIQRSGMKVYGSG